MGKLSGRISVLLLLLFLPAATHAQNQKLFFQPPTYPGSGQTVSADFNHDGKPDLVSADGTVLLGNGDGTFTVATALGVQGNLIATGDFNGDGTPDVLLASFSSPNLYIFLGNGDGTFQPAIISNIGTSLASVVVADVNGDGKPDVLGIVPGTAVLVLLGKGDGTFAPGVTYPVLSNSVNLMTVGDFNGDGKPDIALAAESGTSAPGSVGVLLGSGDGTFQPAMISTGVSTPVGIVAKDFNGDGKLDLAISDSLRGETFVLLGNGNGTFQAPSSPLPATGLLAAVDLRGNGATDLIVGGKPFTEIFLGKGDGTFTAKGAYLGNISNNATNMVTADFNGDGKADIATAGTILLGNGDGTLQGNAAISLNSSGLGPAVTGDFNGDGNSDIAVSSANNASNLYVLLGDGTGKFSVGQTYTLPLPVDAIATADVNGDGKLDFVFITHDPITQDWILNVMLGNGDGSFATPTAFPQGVVGPAANLAFADFNGDHKPDVAVISGGQLTVLLGNGDGTFAAPVSFFAGSGPTSFVTADFNGDGKIDLAVASSAGLGILLGRGDGTFQAATFPVSGITHVFAAADLNADGKADLIGSTGSLQVLLGKGDGTFNVLPPTNQTLSKFVSVADVNSDGKLDLVMSPAVSVLLGNGDGTFGNPIAIVGFCDSIGCPVGSSSFLVADFNRDNRPDVAVDVEGTGTGVVTLLNVSQPPTAPGVGLAPTPLPFGNQTLNTTSTAKNVTLTNTGNAALAITSIAASGDFAEASAGAGACPISPAATLPAAGTCTISVTFTPTVVGARNGTLTITDNATGSPHTVSLTGTGTALPDFTLTASPTSLAVAQGSVGTPVTITVNPANGFNSAVALTCAGAPANSFCALSPTSITAPTTSALTFTAHAILLPLPMSKPAPPLNMLRIVPLLVALMLLYLMRSAERLSTRLAMVSAILVCFTLAACGNSYSPPPDNNTAKGDYPLTVTGTSGNLTHNVVVIVTVD